MSADADALARLAAVIPSQILEVIDTLTKAGHEAVIVGGCVRDAIMGRTPKDWDVASSALPDDVMRLFKKTIPQGLQHGTVKVVIGKGDAREEIEVTTYRGEGAYSDARRPDEVRFGVPLREDLQRRDLTVNAIAYDPTGKRIIDPFDGVKDIAARTLRAVGSAVDRFTEDGLRVMRAVRFAAQLDFDLDSDTEAGIPPALPSLAKVSRERVSDELRKLLSTRQPSRGLRPAFTTGIIASILPELAARLANGPKGSAPNSRGGENQSDTISAGHTHVGPNSRGGENQADTISAGHTHVGHRNADGGENGSEPISGGAENQSDSISSASKNKSDTFSGGAKLVRDGAEKGSHPISHGTKLVRVDDWLARIDRAPVDVRLAAMMAPIDDQKRTLELCKALKFSNQEAELAAALVGVAEAEPPDALVIVSTTGTHNHYPPHVVRRMLSKLDKAKRPHAVELWAAWPRDDLARMAREVIGDPMDTGDLAVRGSDIMKALDMKPSPEVGRILQLLRDKVIDDPTLNTREALLREAQKCELEMGHE